LKTRFPGLKSGATPILIQFEMTLPVPFKDGSAVASTDISTEYEVILLPARDTEVAVQVRGKEPWAL